MGGVLLWLLAALEIQAAGSCPGASEVRARLAPLLPARFPALSSDAATLKENPDGGLTISLVRSDGGATAQRSLPPAASCGEQAEIVAVTLAVWEAEIHPELSLNLDRLPPRVGAGSAPASAAAPAPAPPIGVARPAERRPPLDVRSGTQAPGAAAGSLIALGVGLAAGWQPDSLAPAGRIDLTRGRPAGGWRARLSLTGVGEHQIQVAPGQGSWWRLDAGVGLDYALGFGGGRWAAVAGVGGFAGMVSITGSRFPMNHNARSMDLGAEGLLRLERRARRLRPWVALALAAALRRQDAAVGGTAMTAAPLPRLEPLLAVGADFLWGP